MSKLQLQIGFALERLETGIEQSLPLSMHKHGSSGISDFGMGSSGHKKRKGRAKAIRQGTLGEKNPLSYEFFSSEMRLCPQPVTCFDQQS